MTSNMEGLIYLFNVHESMYGVNLNYFIYCTLVEYVSLVIKVLIMYAWMTNFKDLYAFLSSINIHED